MSVPYDIDAFELVRVEDPAEAEAIATSATGAVRVGPPEAGSWVYESVPVPDAWPATEAIAALNADVWQADGVTGAGVKVAVFDLQWFGATADPDVLGDVETHDCWTTPTCAVPLDPQRPRFGFETGVHGYGCAQVVRDVAPDAELHLVRVNGETTLENAVDWAIREDIDLISMSLSFFNGSFYDGRGRVSAQMDRLAAAGILMVASSGNYAESHWRGPWTDGNADGRMDMDGDDGVWVQLGEGRKTLYAAWNQYGTCATDLDVYVRDADGLVIGRGVDVQETGGDHCEPMERISAFVAEPGWYRVEVVHLRGPTANLSVNLFATAGDFADPVPAGSTADPASHPLVFTVGAVRAEGYLTNGPEPFSSQGPTNGGIAKPDIAGPDGLTTEAYGAEGFYGTSASTPAVAGALALVMSADPELEPFDAAERLQGWALRDGAAFESPDPRYGAGKARLPSLDEIPSPCGHRPLLAPLLLIPLRWRRRRVDCR